MPELTTAPAPQNTGHSFLINGNIGPAVATADATIPSSSNRLIKETAAAGAGSRVSAGVEAAIFACIITVVLLIAGVVFFCIRQRRKNMAGQALHPPSHAEAKLPTPLISPANSCRSARTGTLSTGGASSKSASPQKQGLSFHTSRPSTCSPSDDCTAPSKPSWLRRFFSFFFFFSFRSRDRSASPPLTSLSPPPSPTQMSARARHNIDPDLESNGGSGLAGNKENRVSAATSGSSYYGYYGYNGHYVPYYFPSSPICAPTTNKLEPRRERTPTIRPSKQQDGQKQEQPASPVQQNTDCRTLTSSQTTVDSGSPVPPVPPLPALPISLVSTQSSALGIRESNVSHHNPRLGHASRSATLNGSSVLPSSTLYGNAVTTDAAEPMARLSSRTPVPATVTAGPVRPKRPRELSLDMSSLSMPYPTVPFKAPVVYRRPGKSNTLVLEAANMHSSFAVMQAPPPARNLPKPMFPQAPPLSRTKVIARGEAEARTRNSASSFNPIPLLMRDEDDDHSGCGERGAVDRTRSISSRSSASTNDSGRFAVPGRTLSISRPSQAHYQGSYSVVPRIQTVRPTATANPNDSKRHAGFI
ncbi:hypothetical protein SEPCBS119000_000915 [Sporothrix epigloea]|uniref:Transmembrane protein n=1 Tax=Sporothrix epigloea TaxID=1892477 RepID=A0ABP0DAS2_9PEZI